MLQITPVLQIQLHQQVHRSMYIITDCYMRYINALKSTGLQSLSIAKSITTAT